MAHVTHFFFTGQNTLALERTRERRAGQIAAWPYVEQILLCFSFKYHRHNVEFLIWNVVTVKIAKGDAVIGGTKLV